MTICYFAMHNVQRKAIIIILSLFFIILHNEPTNRNYLNISAICSYIFQHYCVMLMELVVRTLLSYINTLMQSMVIQFIISHMTNIIKILKFSKLQSNG